MVKMILEDTRQQANKHDLKHRWFAEHGIYVNRQTLGCGDYQIPNDGSRAVDTKKDINELIGDIQVKSWGKKKIAEAIKSLNLNPVWSEELYNIITEDDSDRFVEQEISQFCYNHGIDDRVQSKLQELYVKRHGFFHRGLVRAKMYGIKLFVLVENEDNIHSIKDLFKWVNPRSKIYHRNGKFIGYYPSGRPKYEAVKKYPNCIQGQQLAKACLTMEKKYGVTFVFCSPRQSAETIIRLLEGSEE